MFYRMLTKSRPPSYKLVAKPIGSGYTITNWGASLRTNASKTVHFQAKSTKGRDIATININVGLPVDDDATPFRGQFPPHGG